jgi:hypothetical protein
MKYERAKHLKPAEFKRFWGVQLETFKQMVEIVQQHEGRKKKTGRPGKISLEDQVLMTLEYWRVGSDVFPYRSILGSNGIYGLSNYSENRKSVKLSQNFYFAWEEISVSIRFFNQDRGH